MRSMACSWLLPLMLPAGLLLTTAGGCAAQHVQSSDLYSSVPDDFSVDLTILVAPDGERAHERTSRLVVLADGALHYDAKPGKGPNTMPGWVRQLTREDMARLWDAAIRLGLDKPSRADATADLRRAKKPVQGGSVWLLALTANGDRWNYLRAYPSGEPVEASIKRFARSALAMAWAEDTPDDAPAVEPMRWNYGDDPWGTWDAAVAAHGQLEVTDGDSK